MRYLRFSLPFAFFFICFLLVPAGHAQENTGRAWLYGRVTSAETGEPLPGASVAVPALERGTSAGPDGTFRLARLPAGSLTVRFSFVGYETQTRRVRLQSGQRRILDVALASISVEGDEVVVTGTPTAQSVLKATQQVNAVTPADLDTERTAALGDLLEKTVPGAASVKTGAQAGKPVLRGLTGNRVKLLKNGVGQEYYQFGVRHFPNTSLAEAERVEVVRGPASLLYGSDALGGAINIITAPVPEDGFGGRFGGQYFTGNTERAVSGHLRGGLSLGERTTLGARAGGERRVAGNFTTPDAPTFFETGRGGTFGDPKYTGEVPFTNFDQWSGYGQIGLEGAFGSVQLYGEGWQNQQNFVLPEGGPKGSADHPPLGLGQALKQYSVQLRAYLPTASGFVFEPRLSFQRAIRQSAGPGHTLERIEAEEESGDYEYPVDLGKNVYTGRLEVLHPATYGFSGTVGAEVVFQEGESLGPVPLEPSGEVTGAGFFVFEERDLGPAVTLSGGLRADYRQIEADLPQETRDALGIASEGQLRTTFATLSGSMGASYVFAEGVSVFSNLGTGFRAPSLFELYANGQHGGVAAMQRGNPDLDPERTYSADLGLRVRSRRLTGEIVGYLTHFTNYIYLRNTGENAGADGSGAPIYTSGQTTARLGGVEANARAGVLPWLTIGGEAAFLTSRGEDLEANADGDRLLPLIPADRLGAHVRFTPEGTGRLTAPSLQVKLHHAFSKDAAGRYEPFSQFDAGFGPPFGTASTRGYTLVDLTAGAAFQLGPVQPRLTVGVENLFDNAYRNFLDTYKGYALSPGRNVFVKATVPFGTGP